ncbi:hypothetical protein [Rathayibacter toxicus]|uniref:hypothetical protein n=1 Tax=Rathayibacter toxicus TaxID=145458 RepID=UPI000D40FBAB|nr:hypothetical protein [Rathayibacter toxicus]PPI56169.1 hypothetical protein C5D35_02825 [Rathayibacter toxicus]QOD10035.1 hypothetical protein BSG36_08915 [Rathayibacter toxicus]QWL28712.1 hypothetical protein E2R33_08950 [Rathayibacter toxicus]QWL32897.1 hypothetical protein E2R35_08735 [Rathayibacter toxicus]QWL34991.1 hypothetical protein E2R36_08735 [Rathayibacter toxicus]
MVIAVRTVFLREFLVDATVLARTRARPTLPGEASLYTHAVITAPFALTVILEATGRSVSAPVAQIRMFRSMAAPPARVCACRPGGQVPIMIDSHDERRVTQTRAAAQAQCSPYDAS